MNTKLFTMTNTRVDDLIMMIVGRETTAIINLREITTTNAIRK